MDLGTAAAVLSERATQIRTRPREIVCWACGKTFTARSSKAQFCSRACLAKIGYLDRYDTLACQLTKIDRRIKKLIGINPSVHPTLKRISKFIMLAKMNNHLHLPPSSIPV